MKTKKYLKNTQKYGIELQKIKVKNGGEENDYGKYYMKVKLNLDDDLPLNKPLKFHAKTIIIRSVFEEDGQLYPQLFWMTLCMNYKNATV